MALTDQYTGDPGFSLPTFYIAGVHLGLFTEAEARPICLMVAKHADAFRPADITRAFKYIVEGTKGLPLAEREEALRQFSYSLQSGDALNEFHAEELWVFL